MGWNNQQLDSVKQAVFNIVHELRKQVPSILTVLAEQSHQGSEHLPASH
jgi:hypothetical protein